jgi:hypothetical protein
LGGRYWEDLGLRLVQTNIVYETPSQSISWMWWYMCVMPATLVAIGRRIMVQAGPGQKCETLLKKKKKKLKQKRLEMWLKW